MTKYFYIDIEGSHRLSVDDIWPDGDAPEDLTEEDVKALINNLATSDEASYLIEEWNLYCDVTVRKG